LTGLNSDDPATRQNAYTTAALLGIDTKPFEANQAAKALPKLLNNMQPQFNPVTVTPPVSGGAGLPGATTLNDPARQAAYNAPAQSAPSLQDALSATGNPELQALYAPQLIKSQIDQQAKANEPYTLEPGAARFAGGNQVASMPMKPTPNDPFNPDGTPNLAFQKYEADKQAASQAPAWANFNLNKQKLDASIPDDATLHDMATRFVNGDRGVGAGMSRNPMAVTAFQNMISQVGRERGLSQQQISQNLQKFQAGSKATQAFDSGPQGNTTRSLNVAIQHLDTLGQLSDALNNGNVQLFNKIGNTVASQLGSPAPTNFNAAKAIVGDEIIKAIVGSGGALADRENAQNQISAASSPAQLSQVIQTYKQLMAGQLHGLRQQYESSTGAKDFNDKLFPETIKQLEGVAAPKQAGPTSPASLPQKAQGGGTTKTGVKFKILGP